MKAQQAELDAQEAVKQKLAEQASALQGYKDQWANIKNTVIAIATDPMTALMAGMAFLVSKAVGYAKDIKDVSLSMGATVAQGAQLGAVTAQAGVAADMLGGNYNDALDAAAALAGEVGGVSNVTADSVNCCSV